MVWWLNSQGMKNCKSAKSFCLSILTIYTNDCPHKFWHVYCWHVYFFSVKFLNMCKPRTAFHLLIWAGPSGLASYGSGPGCLLSWLGMVNADLLGSSNQKSSYKWNLSFFKAVPRNNLHFYLSSLFQKISSLFNHFCLFQNAILHKMLKLGFLNFKPIFLRMQFSLVAAFFI